MSSWINQNPTLAMVLVAALIILAIIVIAAAVAYSRRHRTEELRDRFGPEYDRSIEEHGDRHDAEAELAARQKRVEKLHIQPLTPEQHTHFAEAWRSVQARFVDDPDGAVEEADDLVNEVMMRRGYPMGDFEQRAGDISVDHPHVVENYRAAHAITMRRRKGQASTEDLRQAMVHYRSLFDELLETTKATR